MAVINIQYSSEINLTLGLASLGSSATFTAGRESSQVDNSSNEYVDALVRGFITVGTTPTADTQIRVYVWGAYESLATTAIDVLDGTDSAETLTNVGIHAALRLAQLIPVPATTSDVRYEVGAFSVADLFGGIMPRFWGVFVTHNTGTALNSTAGNHEISYSGIEYTSV